jgi:hypothetical protein
MRFREFQEEEEAAKTEWEAQQKGNENGEEENNGEEVNEGGETDETVDRWEPKDNEMEAAGEEDAGMGDEEEETEPERGENGEVTSEDTNAAPAEEDEEVRQLLEAGNMEQMANLVLNGEGHRLIGQKSDDPELQGFLNNVPAYMASFSKITSDLTLCST